MNHQPAVIEDIYADARIPAPAYRPTFVKSLAMVPIRTRDPIGAIGNYWAAPHLPTPEEVQLLQTLADAAAIAMENIQSLDEQRQEITERIRAEETLARREALLNEMGRMAAVGGWEVDLVPVEHFTDEMKQLWTDETYRIVEVDRNYIPTVGKGIAFYTPASKPIIERAVKRAIVDGTPFDVEAELITAKGNPRSVRVIAKIDRERGKLVGTFQDITERKKTEQALRASVADKVMLMREIHHRVKNNLQMMSAMLELQSGYVTDEKALVYFKNSQMRIQTIATLHEQFYHNTDVSQIDFANYLRTLVDNLRKQYSGQSSNVSIQFDFQPCTMSTDTAVPLGLVVNELVSNVFKHAFPQNRAGELRIALRSEGDGPLVLEVVDNGVGTSAELRLQRGNSFGLELVRLMVERQLNGKLTIESASQGTRVVCEIEGAK